MVIYSKPTATEGDQMNRDKWNAAIFGNRAIFGAAQAAYENRYPDYYDLPDEHEYTGEVWIDDIKFEFVTGNLEVVEINGSMFTKSLDPVKLTEKADAIAMQLWMQEQQEMINDY